MGWSQKCKEMILCFSMLDHTNAFPSGIPHSFFSGMAYSCFPPLRRRNWIRLLMRGCRTFYCLETVYMMCILNVQANMCFGQKKLMRKNIQQDLAVSLIVLVCRMNELWLMPIPMVWLCSTCLTRRRLLHLTSTILSLQPTHFRKGGLHVGKWREHMQPLTTVSIYLTSSCTRLARTRRMARPWIPGLQRVLSMSPSMSQLERRKFLAQDLEKVIVNEMRFRQWWMTLWPSQLSQRTWMQSSRPCWGSWTVSSHGQSSSGPPRVNMKAEIFLASSVRAWQAERWKKWRSLTRVRWSLVPAVRLPWPCPRQWEDDPKESIQIRSWTNQGPRASRCWGAPAEQARQRHMQHRQRRQRLKEQGPRSQRKQRKHEAMPGHHGPQVIPQLSWLRMTFQKFQLPRSRMRTTSCTPQMRCWVRMPTWRSMEPARLGLIWLRLMHPQLRCQLIRPQPMRLKVKLVAPRLGMKGWMARLSKERCTQHSGCNSFPDLIFLSPFFLSLADSSWRKS